MELTHNEFIQILDDLTELTSAPQMYLNSDPKVQAQIEKAYGPGWVKGFEDGFTQGWIGYKQLVGIIIDDRNREWERERKGNLIMISDKARNWDAMFYNMVDTYADIGKFFKEGFPEWQEPEEKYVAELRRRLCENYIGPQLGHTPKLMVLMPPQYGKSTHAIGYAAYFAKNNQTKNVIYITNNHSVAERDLRVMRKMLGNTSGVVEGNDRDLSIIFKKGGSIRAFGVGTALTGHGADLIVIVDPTPSALDVSRETSREHLWDWYRTTLATRAYGEARQVLFMHRWHKEDLAGKLMREDAKQLQLQGIKDTFMLSHSGKPVIVDKDAWQVYVLKAICDTARQIDPLERQFGEVLGSKRTLEELLLTQQNLGEYWFSAMYQQTIIENYKPIKGFVDE